MPHLASNSVMIQPKKYNAKVKELREFRKHVFEKLGDLLYSISDIEQFLFQIFKNIDATSKKVNTDNNSLNICCEILLKHFKVLDVALAPIGLLTINKVITPDRDIKNNITKKGQKSKRSKRL